MTSKEPKLIMLIGLPGSGKSTFAENYKLKYPETKIHSSDKIREEICNDISNQSKNDEVFTLLHKRIKEDLIQGNDCIYDATNISRKRRTAMLEQLNKIHCKTVCYLIATPYEVCLTQNNKRIKPVPEGVITNMYMHFDIPSYNEGWDLIEIVYMNPNFSNAYGEWTQFIPDTMSYDQDNKNHKLTLGNHCLQCLNYVGKKIGPEHERADDLVVAAALHDCGKPFTKTFYNHKGELTENAHYYRHENVGAYNSLFYNMDNVNVDKLYIAFLIRWHMLPHQYSQFNEKTKLKWQNRIDTDMWEDINTLNEGDLYAH